VRKIKERLRFVHFFIASQDNVCQNGTSFFLLRCAKFYAIK
jgi:hypothetical protein